MKINLINLRTKEPITDDDTLKDYMLDILPHGSGINLDWRIEFKRKKIYCHNSYHNMSEHGFYTRWYDFTAVFSLHDKNEKVPCDYCKSKGYRDLTDLPANHGFKGSIPFTCNVCKGLGYTIPHSFELLRLNFHGSKLPFGLSDYLYEMFYDIEDSIKYLDSRQEDI